MFSSMAMQLAERGPSKPKHPANPNRIPSVSQNPAGKEGKAKGRARDVRSPEHRLRHWAQHEECNNNADTAIGDEGLGGAVFGKLMDDSGSVPSIARPRNRRSSIGLELQ